MIVKQHTTEDKQLSLAICDDDLLGTVIENDTVSLDLTSSFFAGTPMQEHDVLPLVQSCAHMYVVGNNSVAWCIAQQLCKAEDVKTVNDVQHILIVRM